MTVIAKTAAPPATDISDGMQDQDDVRVSYYSTERGGAINSVTVAVSEGSPVWSSVPRHGLLPLAPRSPPSLSPGAGVSLSFARCPPAIF